MTEDKNTIKKIEPSIELIRQAKLFPNGWVYKIEGNYSSHRYIPAEYIQGAWKVDCDGNIESDFIPNSNYKSNSIDVQH
jgi:hypothetical protein